jgi:hypothetical protein
MRVPKVPFYLYYDFAGYVPFLEKNQESKGFLVNAAKNEKTSKKRGISSFFVEHGTTLFYLYFLLNNNSREVFKKTKLPAQNANFPFYM